jgi:hypothetical protein
VFCTLIDPIYRLSGHSSGVSSVSFDLGEEILASGSSGGSIKLFDLQSGQCQRTLIGHKSSINSIDFHPYGQFLCSGSSDCTMKVWDSRAKGCIQTYKGHNSAISYIKHTPDGQSILTGDNQGIVKCWDLASGKLVQDVDTNSLNSSISCIDFHPSEFIACISSDLAVDWIDLEKFQLVNSTKLFDNNKGAKRVCFSAAGEVSYYADNAAITLCNWENIDSDPILVQLTQNNYSNSNLHGLADLAVDSNNNRLITAAINQNVVNIAAVNNIDKVNSTTVQQQNKPRVSREAEKEQKIQPTLPPQRYSHSTNNAKNLALETALDHTLIASTAAGPLGLSAAQFNPANTALFNPNSDAINKIYKEVLSEHDVMRRILSDRLAKSRVLVELYQRNDRAQLFQTLIELSNSKTSHQTLVDFLTSCESYLKAQLNLEYSLILFKLCNILLDSQFESYVVTSLNYLKFLLQSFAALIQATLKATPQPNDFAFQQRFLRANEARDILVLIQPKLTSRSNKLQGKANLTDKQLSLVNSLQQTQSLIQALINS